MRTGRGTPVKRQIIPELMDDPMLDPREHDRAMRGLRRINLLSDSAGILWKPIARLAGRIEDRPLRMLDVATGAGDVPLALLKKARRHGVTLTMDACDVSDQAILNGQSLANAAGEDIRFFKHDVLRDELPGGYDIVTCSLFLHHVPTEQAAPLLARLARAANRLLLVNDLERGVTGLTMARIGVRLLSRSPVVHVDGPRSVRAAFSITEVRELARAARLGEVRVTRCWPFRFLMEWHRS